MKWGMGIGEALFPSKKKKKNPSLIFDTVCPNHFLLCNSKRDPSVRLPVFFYAHSHVGYPLPGIKLIITKRLPCCKLNHFTQSVFFFSHHSIGVCSRICGCACVWRWGETEITRLLQRKLSAINSTVCDTTAHANLP